MKTISFIIISHNSFDDLKKYFDSFLKFNCVENLSFLVLETGASNETFDLDLLFGKRLKLSITKIDNFGYAYACNYGYLQSLDSEIYIFSNPDIIFTKEIIQETLLNYNSEMYGTLIHNNSNGRRITFDLYPKYKNIFTEIFRVHRLINWFNVYHPRYCYISGAFMIIGKNIIEVNGLFDENYFLYYEETDFFYRLRNNTNYKILNKFHIIHNVSSSIDSTLNIEKYKIQFKSLKYYCEKHKCQNYIKNLYLFYRLLGLFKRKYVHLSNELANINQGI